METYSSFHKPVTFMYFWLNYYHIERIPVAVKDRDHLFNTALKLMIMNT